MHTLSKLSLIAAAALTTATAFADLTDAHPPIYTTRDTFSLGVSGDGLTSVGFSVAPGSQSAFKMVGATPTTLLPLGGYAASTAVAASHDGSVIVGFSDMGGGLTKAVFWTSQAATNLDSGSTFLYSEATGVSADGNTIVGWGFNGSLGTIGREEVFYRIGASRFDLGRTVFNGFASKATGVSADGNTIVGTVADSFSTPGMMSGFVYTVGDSSTPVDAAAAVPGFNLAGLTFTQLTAVSGNGAIAVGYASSSLSHGDEQAFKFTRSGATYVALGALGVGSWSIARAINSDGSVIVGQSDNQAFKYQNGTMTGLGFLQDGNTSDATGVSADGSVIVGYSNLTGGTMHAFVYANQTMLDADEWLRSLNGPGSLVSMTANLNLLPLEGAHHRPLMSYDSMGKQGQAWATGDFGTSSRQVDQHKTTGEIGVSQAYGDFVFGLAAGHATLNQDLLFGGNAHITGNYLLAEADCRLADKESVVSLVLLRGDWDADATRGYETGSGTDTSHGSTSLNTSSVRVRYDGPAQKFITAVSASPFASFTLTRTTADAYTEAGGSFPASFGKQQHTAQEGRLGVTAKVVSSPSTTLLFTAEWIHRFDGAGAGLTATNASMGTLTASGIAPTANQARFGFDVDHKLSADTLLNLSLHAAGNGSSADFAAALSVRRAF